MRSSTISRSNCTLRNQSCISTIKTSMFSEFPADFQGLRRIPTYLGNEHEE